MHRIAALNFIRKAAHRYQQAEKRALHKPAMASGARLLVLVRLRRLKTSPSHSTA
jgi:hypothetical protein